MCMDTAKHTNPSEDSFGQEIVDRQVIGKPMEDKWIEGNPKSENWDKWTTDAKGSRYTEKPTEADRRDYLTKYPNPTDGLESEYKLHGKSVGGGKNASLLSSMILDGTNDTFKKSVRAMGTNLGAGDLEGMYNEYSKAKRDEDAKNLYRSGSASSMGDAYRLADRDFFDKIRLSKVSETLGKK